MITSVPSSNAPCTFGRVLGLCAHKQRVHYAELICTDLQRDHVNALALLDCQASAFIAPIP